MAIQSLPRQQSSTTSCDVMDMLRQHIPLTLFVDMAFPCDLRAMGVEVCA